MLSHSKNAFAQHKNEQKEILLLSFPNQFFQRRGNECFGKNVSATSAEQLKEDKTGFGLYSQEAMARSRRSIFYTQNIILVASKQAQSRSQPATNLDSICQKQNCLKNEQEATAPFTQIKQQLPSSDSLKGQLASFRLSENTEWKYCSPINLSATKSTEIAKNHQRKSSHRRSLATNERPMNNFGGTLKKILLQKFKTVFGSHFKQIELLVRLESKWLGKELLQELFNSSQLRPVIAKMFETKHFHKAFRLSKVRSPECLAKFMRQIDAYQEAFQCGKIQRVEMRE